MITEICQKVIDGFGMPAEWTLSIVVPIFNGKDDSRNSRAAKCHEDGMKVVER